MSTTLPPTSPRSRSMRPSETSAAVSPEAPAISTPTTPALSAAAAPAISAPTTPAPTVPPGVTTKRVVQDLISQARQVQHDATHRGRFVGGLLVAGASTVLLYASFTPLEVAPLAWVALVPLLLLTRLPRPVHRQASAVYVAGWCYFMATLQWMRLGDPTMYFAWLALASYLAVYWVLFVASVRWATQTARVPLVLAAPIAWTGLEFIRAHFLSGFGWYLLGHSQYQWLSLIQVSDLVGAYGVSFLIAMSNAAIAALVPLRWMMACGAIRPTEPLPPESINRLTRWQPVGVLALLLACLGYGGWRMSHANFTAGPRMALIQGNFNASARATQDDAGEVYLTHARLTGLAVREQPQVIVWPETMFRWPLFTVPPNSSAELRQSIAPHVPPDLWTDPTIPGALKKEADRAGAAMIVGLEAVTHDAHGLLQHNSAALVEPERGVTNRYDKRHLVPFGEYLPLREWVPGLSWLTPYRADFGLNPGQHHVVFEAGGARLLPIICFEDTVSHLVRDMLATEASAGRSVDVLVNMTNDGWFHGSSELNQHLITAAFRCVEGRVPMVRAVNTGISAFISGNGEILEPEVFLEADIRGEDRQRPARDRAGHWKKRLNAVLVSHVPLDPRSSLYVFWGDWFAALCSAATMCALGLAFLWPRLNLGGAPGGAAPSAGLDGK